MARIREARASRSREGSEGASRRVILGEGEGVPTGRNGISTRKLSGEWGRAQRQGHS